MKYDIKQLLTCGNCKRKRAVDIRTGEYMCRVPDGTYYWTIHDSRPCKYWQIKASDLKIWLARINAEYK